MTPPLAHCSQARELAVGQHHIGAKKLSTMLQCLGVSTDVRFRPGVATADGLMRPNVAPSRARVTSKKYGSHAAKIRVPAGCLRRGFAARSASHVRRDVVSPRQHLVDGGQRSKSRPKKKWGGPNRPPESLRHTLPRDYPPAGIAFGVLLGSSAGTGFSGCCRSGIRSFDAPPGKRLMFLYLMIDWSNSKSTPE